MFDPPKAAQVHQRTEIDVPVVDLETALAQQIGDHVLARSLSTAGRGNSDKVPDGCKLRLEAGIDGVEDSLLDIAGGHGPLNFPVAAASNHSLSAGTGDLLSESKPRPYTASGACAPHRFAMTVSRAGFACILLGLVWLGMAQIWPARAQYVGREQDIVGLRLGQRMLVDDGTCPVGQVKEVSGAKMTPTGVIAARKCVPRLGPKKK
jgi:hypothetical protein